jgi:hypothetical protein
VRLWPLAKDSQTTRELAVGSWEARAPLLAAKTAQRSNKLPAAQSGVAVSRPGVLVTAFGENPDGKGTLLRVWEQAGVSGSLGVKLPPGSRFSTASPVDLRGVKSGGALRIIDGEFAFPLGSFAPASYLLH